MALTRSFRNWTAKSASNARRTAVRFMATSGADGLASAKLSADNIEKKRNKLRFQYIRHPWLDGNSLPEIHSLSDTSRILTFLAGHVASGAVSAAVRDCAFLDDADYPKALEIVLQNMFYGGVPRTLNAFAVLKDAGVTDRWVCEPQDRYSNGSDWATYRTAGEDVCNEIYGEESGRFLQHLRLLHPALEHWTLEFGYGRIRAREVPLSQRDRQLCALMTMAGTLSFPQFKSSILSCINTGATIDEIRGTLDVCDPVWGRDRMIMIDALWADLNKAKLRKLIQKRSALTEVIPPTQPIGLENVATPSPHLSTMRKTFTEPDEELQFAKRQYVTQRFRHMRELPDWLRLLCLLAAGTTAGNLTMVSLLWSLLPASYHQMGMEIILQTVLFAGVPRVLSALECIHTEVGVAASAFPSTLQPAEDPDQMLSRGEETLQLIYQKQYGPLRERLKSFHPDLERWIVEYAYGRILSREVPGLTAAHRELCALAAMSGEAVIPQLHSHLLGALNAGATIDQVRGVLDMTYFTWGNAAQSIVDGYWLEFKRKHTPKTIPVPN